MINAITYVVVFTSITIIIIFSVPVSYNPDYFAYLHSFAISGENINPYNGSTFALVVYIYRLFSNSYITFCILFSLLTLGLVGTAFLINALENRSRIFKIDEARDDGHNNLFQVWVTNFIITLTIIAYLAFAYITSIVQLRSGAASVFALLYIALLNKKYPSRIDAISLAISGICAITFHIASIAIIVPYTLFSMIGLSMANEKRKLFLQIVIIVVTIALFTAGSIIMREGYESSMNIYRICIYVVLPSLIYLLLWVRRQVSTREGLPLAFVAMYLGIYSYMYIINIFGMMHRSGEAFTRLSIMLSGICILCFGSSDKYVRYSGMLLFSGVNLMTFRTIFLN